MNPGVRTVKMIANRANEKLQKEKGANKVEDHRVNILAI
jgi:hypothetical protein